MPFRQATLDLARQRTEELSDRLEDFVSAFDAQNLFTGPSLYFHHKTLAIRRELRSVEACLNNDRFFECLYATLASWGMHRMGPGNTKLVDLSVMVTGFRGQIESLKKLERYTIQGLSTGSCLKEVDLIWKVINEVPVGIGQTKIVSGSKALHHILPDLVPPIDREYTVTFFFNNKNAIQGNETKQRETFHVMYPHFVTICREKEREITSLLGHSMNTSITKVVDNAIVGYGRTVLRISGEVDDRLAVCP